MLELLKKHFGYESFRPLQAEIINHVLQKKDCLVLMPTGGGKSLCYQLPALVFEGVAIVVSPLISLMKDQVDALLANGVPAAFINSSLTPSQILAIQKQAEEGSLKILYIAPERLPAAGFAEFLAKLNIGLIAIDEAHCISEWGHDFRPDYRNLKVLREMFPNIPVMALTATATEKVRDDIVKQLSLRENRIFISSFDRPNLSYKVLPKKSSAPQLVELLKKYSGESVIIYCFSRADTEKMAEELNLRGFKAAAYHAGLNAETRRETQEKFIRDEINIVTATIAFGMGIDKPDVRLVVHQSLPKSVEGYYQETGRAGRDGLPSECVLFFSYGDRRNHGYFIDQMEDEESRMKAWAKLEEMLIYGDLNECRRKYLLRYFGENYKKENCESCDVCLEPVEEFDATEITQKILSAIIRTGQRFGGGYIAKVLLGEEDERIKQQEHNKLSVFGIVKDYDKKQLMRTINFLVARKVLEKTSGEYPVLHLTTKGAEFLKNRQTINLPKPEEGRKKRRAKAEEVEDYDLELFARLRVLRKVLADDLGVPPYVVFGDATLREMATYFPQNLESLSKIFGLGRQKLEKFGAAFLKEIRDYAEVNKLEEKPKDQNTEAVFLGSTYDATRLLLLQKLSLYEIANKRGIAFNTVLDHVEKLAAQEPALDINHLRPETATLTKILAAFEQAGGWQLFPARTILGEEFTYDEIRLARIFLKRENNLDF